MNKTILVVLVTSALLLPLTGRAQADRPIVAVFPIEAKRVKLSPGLLDLLADQLATGLAASGRYQVVPRDQLKQRLVAEKKKSFSGCYDQSCQVELGRELAAQKTLATQIGKIGKTCTVTASLFDLRTAATENAARVQGGCREEELLKSINQAVDKLNRGQPASALGQLAERPDPAAKGGAPSKSGTLSRNEIKRVIQRDRNGVKYCYEKALMKDPSLEGGVTVAFTVGPTGRVTQAKIAKSSMQDPAVGDCVVARVKTWQFPEPKGGGDVRISYPFVFKNAP